MKKVIIFVLLGTVITACSTQKKATKATEANYLQQTIVEEKVSLFTPSSPDTIQSKDTINKTIVEDAIPEITNNVVQQDEQKDTVSQHNAAIYGHINWGTIIAAMPEYNIALQHMDSVQKYLANQYEQMKQEYLQKETEYLADTTALPMVQQMREQELQSLLERIKYFQGTAQQQLELEHNKLMMPIYEKLQNIIKKVSNDMSLIAVFDDTYILYSSENSIDVTKEVIKEIKKQ